VKRDGDEKYFRLHSLKKNKVLKKFSFHKKDLAIYAISFLGDNYRLGITSNRAFLRVLDLRTG